jgi:hypothetical protein
VNVVWRSTTCGDTSSAPMIVGADGSSLLASFGGASAESPGAVGSAG